MVTVAAGTITGISARSLSASLPRKLYSPAALAAGKTNRSVATVVSKASARLVVTASPKRGLNSSLARWSAVNSEGSKCGKGHCALNASTTRDKSGETQATAVVHITKCPTARPHFMGALHHCAAHAKPHAKHCCKLGPARARLPRL